MGKYIDLTGQRFGRLTILERDYDYAKEHNLKNKNAYWKCQCDCGIIKSITTERLKNGETVSCGCYNKTKFFIDLTGKKFGRWTVIELDQEYNLPNHSIYWKCQCDCGTIRPVMGQNLRNGISKSCGCYDREQASIRMKKYNELQKTIKIGDKYGKLTVLEYAGLRKQNSRNKNESWYLCKCECGTQKEIRGNDLVTGSVSSCGCISSLGENYIKNILDMNNIKYKKEYIFQDLKNPKTNHNLRFDFAVFNDNNEIEYLIEFDGRQHYTGPEATWSHGSSLEDIQFRDNLKNSYCKEHNILLKRIPYTQLSCLSYEKIVSDIYNIN